MAATARKPVERPLLYTPELVELICERLAKKESMRSICEDPDMPCRKTVERWMAADPELVAKCARAREDSAELHGEEMDTIERDTLSGVLAPQAASVVLANKRWRMEKLKPKVYGAKLTQELSGPDGGPIDFRANLSDAELLERVRVLNEQLGIGKPE